MERGFLALNLVLERRPLPRCTVMAKSKLSERLMIHNLHMVC
jgi:hypothetical protein